MVDQLFHRHRHALFVGQDALGVGEIDRAVWHGVEHLAADADRLAHFLHADLIAGVAVAFFGDRHVEFVLFVAEVRAVFAEVASDTGGAQVRAGHAPGDGRFAADHTDIDHAVEEDFVFIEQLADFFDGDGALVEEGADGGIEASGHVAQLAADAGVGRGEASARELLAEVIDLFALGEGVEENRHRADVHGANADAQHVGRDASEFAAEHAQRLAARWQRPVHQLFDGAGIGDVVG